MDEAKKLTHRLLYAANCFPNVTLRFRSARFSSGFLPVHRPGTAPIVVISLSSLVKP
jgi:hypothetical protein